MADNLTLPASAQVVATDDIAGVHYPRTKITIGADGVNGGDVSSANPLPTTNAAMKATDSPYTIGDPGVFVLAKRRDEDDTTVANGDYTGLNLDSAGRLKVSTQPGTIVEKIQAITANAQTVFLNVERSSNITVSMVATTLVGHAAIFEYSNNSSNGVDGNWYVVQVVRSNANTVETATGTLTTTPVYGWEASVNAYKWFRIRATSHTSGTATYTILPGAYATEPIPAIQTTGTQSISGTVGITGSPSVIASLSQPSASFINSAATTNGTVVKAGAGTVYGGIAANNGLVDAFLKFHNSTTITVGTTVVTMTIKLPAGSATQISFGPMGMRYGTGICMSVTGAVPDNDTTPIEAAQVKVNLAYL